MRPGSSKRRRAGFTMVELGIVILIIGIMMSFLLVVSWEGLKRANERATQSLIQKLDIAVTDRIEALASQRQQPNNAHRFLAMSVVPDAGGYRFVESEARARLIAQIDYIKRELPDVFFLQYNPNTDPLPQYPLNFAGMPFDTGALEPGAASTTLGQIPNTYAPFVLPIGRASRINLVWDDANKTFVPGGGANFIALGDTSGLAASQVRFTSSPGGEGIFGASYSAIGSLMRLLGDNPDPNFGGSYPTRGYNGIDDDGNGLIDELTASELGLSGAEFANLTDLINIRLSNHRHITARSEMLYAVLVGGAGPLGSVFSPDDFTNREVQDTDGDGLPEFVDAWGQPLQFYRWPIYFSSEQGVRSLQLGDSPYTSITDPREENPLDPNQLLVAPGWWSDLANLPGGVSDANSANIGNRANLFSRHFFSLVDPYADENGFVGSGHWDRTSYYRRRAYFFKHLILSAGTDRQFGVGSFGVSYATSGQSVTNPTLTADQMILIENQASRSDPNHRIPGAAGLYQQPPTSIDSMSTLLLRERWGVDDITNHALNTPGSGGR